MGKNPTQATSRSPTRNLPRSGDMTFSPRTGKNQINMITSVNQRRHGSIRNLLQSNYLLSGYLEFNQINDAADLPEISFVLITTTN